MEITVNGVSMDIAESDATIGRLLAIRKVESPDMVAVQLNGKFLDKNDYATTSIANGDEVEFLFFMGGGS
jgi:sulfur carrier protein